MSFHEKWRPDCEFCAKANSMHADGDERGAIEYIGEHEQCVLCGILVGPKHYARYQDTQGRCFTCRNMEMPV